MLEKLLSLELYHFLFVFARIGAALMTMPVFSSGYFPRKIRLWVALAITAAVTPLLAAEMPAVPTTATELGRILILETVVGVFFGLGPYILLTAVDLIGTNAAMATSFSNATVLDPQSKIQSTVLTSFLTLCAVMLIVTTNLHHVMLGAVLDSYRVFPVGNPLPMEDFSATSAKALGLAFNYGFRIGAPFVLMIVLLYSSMGVMSRLMPQLNIIFVVMPAQVYLGLALMMVTLPAMMWWFLSFFDDNLALLWG